MPIYRKTEGKNAPEQCEEIVRFQRKVGPESTKMVPRSDLGIRAALEGQNCKRLNIEKSIFSQTSAILVHFWCPSKSSLGPKTARKE